MQLSGTIQGVAGIVNVVDINIVGSQIYTTYVDASNNLKVRTYFLSGDGTLLGTVASIVK